MEEILIYGFSEAGRCPYCDNAKAFLDKNGKTYTFKDVQSHRQELMDLRGLSDLKGQTVPQVFIDGEYIGGYTELKLFL